MRTILTAHVGETAPEHAEVVSRDEDGMAVLFWELPGVGGYGLGGYRAALKDMDAGLIVATRTYQADRFTREQARKSAILSMIGKAV